MTIEKNKEGVVDASSDPPSVVVDDELGGDEQDSLLTVVEGLQKQVSDLKTQMKTSEQRQSRRNLRAASRRAVRHSIMNRKSAIATNSLMVPMEEEEDDTDDDTSVEEEEVRTFPNNTFSFLLLARYPLIEREKAEPEETEPIENEHNEETGIPSAERRRYRRSQDFLCLPFWLGIGILVLQVLIYSLVLQNSTDFASDKNKFNFPTNVDISTRTAELLAVIITVYTQNNIFQGVDLYVQSFEHIGKTPGVTKWKYYTAATTQVVVGMYGIVVTFIIIMQAEDVVDLLLDFTAMEFVAQLDDAAFVLSLRGFLGRPVRITANVVRAVRYRPKDKRKWLRKWPLFVVFVALFSCYLLIRGFQADRRYTDNQVYVQFHDDAIPWLSSLSGSYIGCTMSSSDLSELRESSSTDVGRIIYSKLPVEGCQRNWKKEHGVFFYCDEKSWVFAVGEGMVDPCNKWTMKSFSSNPSDTDQYDLTSHSTDLWFAKDSTDISDDGVQEAIQFLQSFSPPEKLKEICNVLEAKGIVFSFPFYERLEDVLIADRPVYFAGDSKSAEYIFYIGRRWVAVKESDLALDCLTECEDSAGIFSCRSDCLKSSFDPYTSNYTANLISDPMDLRTIDDTWIPSDGLVWKKAKGEGSSSRPDTKRASLAEQIDKIPNLLNAVNERKATPEELTEAEALFAQSASLNCTCKKDACPGIYSCPAGEVKLWIDVKTDNWAEEILFFVMGKDKWDSILTESRQVYNIDEWYEAAEFASNFSVFNNTGFFEWQTTKNGELENMDQYKYMTCVPGNECGILYFRDGFGDGIYFPGGFDVYFDGRRIPVNEADTQFLRHCVYQFGNSCGQSVQCSSGGVEFPVFEPQIRCRDGFAPLIFEVLPSDHNRSLLLSDFDYFWLDNLPGEDFPVNNEPGFFDWQRMQTPALDTSQTFRYATCVPSDVCATLDTEYFYDSLRVTYNETEIVLTEDQYSMDYCFYQLGPACETEIRCSDNEIAPPFNPTLDCPAGETSLAFSFQTDSYPAESKVVVADIDSWRQGLWLDAAAILRPGYFDWGVLETGTFDASGKSYLYSTCVPDDVCGVVALIDSFGDGLEVGGMSVFYDEEEIVLRNPLDEFGSCQFQFGACQQRAYCTAKDVSEAPTSSPL